MTSRNGPTRHESEQSPQRASCRGCLAVACTLKWDLMSAAPVHASHSAGGSPLPESPKYCWFRLVRIGKQNTSRLASNCRNILPEGYSTQATSDVDASHRPRLPKVNHLLKLVG